MSGTGFDDLLAGIGTPAAGTAPGWYGKLPALGDFAHRRLPQPVVDTVDGWLSAGMAASREQLGAEWLDVYLTGPLWRFAWAPGVVDAQWWFGVLMPSVDAVGRYFPLVVARPAAGLPASARAVAGLDVWYREVSAAVLATLQAGASVDAFEAALVRAPAWPDDLPPRRPDAAQLPGRTRHALPGEASLSDWVGGVLLGDATDRCAGRTLWWPDHARTPDTSLSVTAGLPEPTHFALLLEGEW